MKFRLQWPGLIALLLIAFTLGSGAARCDDNGVRGGEHGKTSIGNRGDSQSSDDNVSGDDGGGDSARSATSEESRESPQKEQEEARKAVANGKAAPLTTLLKKLKTDYPGQILDVALITEGTKLKFIVKYIDKTNLVKTVSLDALTLEDD